jgi:hypothetical protein
MSAARRDTTTAQAYSLVRLSSRLQAFTVSPIAVMICEMMAGATLGAAVDFVPGSVMAQPMEKKGTTPYVTHFIFRPLMSIDIPGLGTATNLEAVGTTQNMKGEKMLDKMSARCAALSVASGDKKYIDGACVLTDSDGDQIFSTFDTRDVDKSQVCEVRVFPLEVRRQNKQWPEKTGARYEVALCLTGGGKGK